MSRRTRIETVAHAIETHGPQDPGFSAKRYAVKPDQPQGWAGPDVTLGEIDNKTYLDVAGWTCWSYPDLCMDYPGIVTNRAEWYYRNAQVILGLTEAEADLLFAGMVAGKPLLALETITPEQAVASLRSLGRVADIAA